MKHNFNLRFILTIFLFTIIFISPSCWNNPKNEAETIVEIPKENVDIAPVIEPVTINYDTNIWTNLRALIPDVELDIRYATKNNFVGEIIYDCGECFLRPEVAKALVKVHHDLKEKGYGGIKLFDCYRPRPAQQKLWDILPDPKYVGNPKNGSMHNRGAAVDLTILSQSGEELNMGTEFDYFGKKAYHDYPKSDTIVMENRALLKDAMYKRGFKHITTEWWHYSYVLKNYPLSDWLWKCEDVK